MKTRKICAWLLVLLMPAAALCGCTTADDYPPPLVLRDQTPPEPGETVNEGAFETDLYFLIQKGKELKAQRRSVPCDTQTSRAEAAILALISGPERNDDGMEHSVSSLFELNRVEICGDVCNVYLEGLQFFPSSTQWLTLRAAIAATVAAAEQIGAVNVYYYEMELGYQEYPLGAMQPLDVELSTYLREMGSEYSSLYAAGSGTMINEDTEYVTQIATLYFANTDGTLLTARNTEMRYPEGSTKAEIAKLLVETLSGGDPKGKLEPSLPADFRLLAEPNVIYSGKTEDGAEDPNSDCVIELVIAQPEAANYDETLMCGALTMTLVGFIPKVSGVRVCIGEEVQEPVAPGQDGASGKRINILRTLSDKTFRHNEFQDILGHSVDLYYPDNDSVVLHRVSRITPEAALYDPLVRLRELLGGASDSGISYAPFVPEDVESVYVEGDIAVINWKEGFSDKLRAYLSGATTSAASMASMRETLFIYGVVNTLTDMPMISSVWMLENGEKIAQVNNIYLGGALVRNPGLIVEE